MTSYIVWNFFRLFFFFQFPIWVVKQSKCETNGTILIFNTLNLILQPFKSWDTGSCLVKHILASKAIWRLYRRACVSKLGHELKENCASVFFFFFYGGSFHLQIPLCKIDISLVQMQLNIPGFEVLDRQIKHTVSCHNGNLYNVTKKA